MNEIAVIFDLDGTLVDNNSFHIIAWQEFYKKRNRTLTEEEYKAHFNGKTNEDVLNYVFNEQLAENERQQYTDEKEGLYRKVYAPHIQPIKGLIGLLGNLKNAGIPIAMATSGIKPNIDYFFEHVPIREYFKTIVYSVHIKKGKPDPEIYFLTAKKLNVAPADCVVFEDSVSGIQSAKSAGMKVVAIASTHSSAELKEADKVIDNFEYISLEDIFELSERH